MKATCLILAGGKGTRISSILGATPKCLATVNHRPFLRWQVSSLIMAGVDQIVLSLGHGANLVLEEIGKAWAKEININSVVEPEPLGTGGAIRYAWKFIENSEILILNGDTFLGNRLDGMFLPLEKSENNLMRMGLVRVKDGARFGAVETDQRGLVTGFSEKMVAGDVLVNAGIYRMHRDALSFKS
jgi:D-glycero-alpha-D-manno-heptose 1-phosphate guanylyltransferase